MNPKLVKNAVKEIAGYGIKKLVFTIILFAIVVNAIMSGLVGLIAADGDVWKPLLAVSISAIVLFVMGIIIAIKLTIGLTIHQGIVKADLVRVTVNAILNRFSVEPNLGLTKLEFNNYLDQALQEQLEKSATDGKLSWIVDKIQKKVTELSGLGITRFADAAFKESESVSIQTFSDSAVDSVNSKISTIKRGVITECSIIIIAASAIMLGIALLIRAL